MADVKFLGVGRRSEPDPDAVRQLVAQLFPPELLDGDDLVAWFAALSDRIELVERALEVARHRRNLLVAAMHDRCGQSYAEIADSLKGALSPQRAGQMAARGRSGR